jgi:hypothetical protein
MFASIAGSPNTLNAKSDRLVAWPVAKKYVTVITNRSTWRGHLLFPGATDVDDVIGNDAVWVDARVSRGAPRHGHFFAALESWYRFWYNLFFELGTLSKRRTGCPDVQETSREVLSPARFA